VGKTPRLSCHTPEHLLRRRIASQDLRLEVIMSWLPRLSLKSGRSRVQYVKDGPEIQARLKAAYLMRGELRSLPMPCHPCDKS
jgi:hypothetical protein